MKNTNFWKSSLMILLFCFGLTSLWGQAELPLSRTAWGSTPTGWTDNGTHRSTGFACTGNSGGSLQATGKYYVVQFDSTPNELTYSLKTGGISGTSKLEVQESVDGIIWNNISVYQNVTYNTCQVETKQLSPSTRFVRFYYTKGSGNMDIDDVSITKGVQSYSITYDGNSADGGTAPTDNNEYEENDEVTVLGQGTLEKIGYHFIGWNTLANGSGTSYAESATFSMPANDVTLYAQWAINTYTVTYDGNGSDGGSAPVDGNNPYNHGSDVTVLGHGDLTLTDHSFLSWNTQADGLGTAYLTGSTISNITSDVMLYAQWLDDSLDPQTITFDPLADATYGDAAFELTATSDSGLPVSYASSNENVATVSGSTVTIVGVGTTDITASQLGDEDYQPAVPVVQTLTVNQKNLTISGATVTDKTYDGTTTATIDVSGASLTGVVGSDDVDFAAGTGEFVSADAGSDIAVLLTSDFSLTGTAAGNYTLTQPVLTGNILKADQTIAGFEDLTKYENEEPFTLPATTVQGLPLSYESSNEAVATVSGNTVTIAGIGTTTITASTDDDDNYNAFEGSITLNVTEAPVGPCGEEDFESTTLPTAYGGGSFTNNGITWTYSRSRDHDGNSIDGNGLMLQRASDSYLEATISGSIGTFSFDYRKAYTGNSVRQLELLVDGVQVATTDEFGNFSGADTTIYNFTYDINTTETVTIRIKNVGSTTTGRQTVIDNITWSCYSDGPATQVATPTITATGFENGVDTYFNTANITLATTTDGATIYYTTDGTEPTTASSEYTAAFDITASATIKAIAVAADLDNSEVAEKTITIIEPASAAIPYEEAFNNTLGDWISYTNAGVNWTAGSSGVSVNGHNSQSELVWLISPKFLSVGANSLLSFNHSSQYTNGNDLEIRYSTDYAGYGNPATATWNTIQTIVSVSNGSVSDLVIPVSGDVHIALVYTDVSLPYAQWTISNLSIDAPSTDPALSVSVPELTGFTYGVGNGPSDSQSFVLSGENLDGSADVTLLADTGFEISLNDTDFEGELILTDYEGANTTIYVRMASGLALGAHSGIVMIDGYGVDSEVEVSGNVLAVPVITEADDLTAQVDVEYSYQVIATEEPFSYVISSDALPTGLTLNEETGLISGTPTVAGEFIFGIEATNTAGTSEEGIFILDVAKGTQTVTGLADINAYFGDADITLPATTDQGFTIVYDIDPSDVATISGNTLSITGVGTVEFMAYTEDGDANYEDYLEVFTVTVTEVPITPESGMLYITEVSDASAANNEFLEIYNNTGNAIDMTGSKIKMLNDNTSWTFGNQLTTATIPARGFLILTRNADQAAFETAFGPLNANTVLVKGTNGQFFGTDNSRRWQLLDADDNIIDDTEVTVAGSSYRTYQDIFTGDFTTNAMANASPGTLEYLVYTAGDWTNSIAADATTSTEDVYVFGDLEISSAIQAANFGLAANGSVNIAAGGSLTLSGTLTNNAAAADFVVSNNANLIQTSDVANDGAITVIRNSEPMKRLDYAMWSSPVAGQNLIAFSPLTVNGVTNYVGSTKRIYIYDGEAGYDNTFYDENTVMDAGIGYLFRAPNNYNDVPQSYEGVFTGVPNNGTIAVPLTTIPGTEDPYTSMGNPYPSNINFVDFMNANNHIGSLNFWRNGSGAYMQCTLGGCTNGTLAENFFIAVGQGFIVEHDLEMPADDVTFTNAMRVDNPASFYNKTDEADKHRFWLNLRNAADESLNQILTGYMDGATNGVDHQIDAKLFGYEGSALYNLVEEGAYVIQGRALPFESSDVVPLGFRAAESGKFKVSLANFDGLFAEGAVSIYLKDKELDITHNLMESDYEFESAQGEFKERFEVVYETEGTMGTGDFDSNLVQIYQHNNRILVSSKTEQILSVELFDLQGRNIHRNAKVNANVYQIESASFGTQVLVVRVQTQNGEVVTKKLINK